MNDKKIQMEDRKMDYKDMKAQLEQMATDNYKEFTKAFISFEKGIDDPSALDKLYDNYQNNDSMMLLNDTFDEMIEELHENGELSQQVDSQQIEENNLVNLVGNIVGEVEVVERKTREGEVFTAVNFSVASKDDEGNKLYTNCSAYGDKGEIPKNFNQGDFVKIFGKIRTSIDDQGKIHSNVRVLASKLLKARNQFKGTNKSSVLGAIKQYKKKEQTNPKQPKKQDINSER